jgi:diguanylate cyclase (GGDEF)-like protein
MKIVIVEDSELVKTQLTKLIEQQPRFKVIGYASGEDEAVDLILTKVPDVVLLDLSLAPGSGIRVLERIRAAACGARVLIFTNHVEKRLELACLTLGADGLYDKSGDLTSCLERLHTWLPPLPANEIQRLEELHITRLLDSEEQEVFDNLTHLAAEIAQVPIALISLVDEHRLWFLSRIGVEAREISRSTAFCAHTILGGELLEVNDANLDPRFRDNPLVAGAPHIRFYAGVPLVLPSGEALGALCVIDSQPRELTAGQRRALTTLASSILAEIDLRRRLIHLEQESERRSSAEAHSFHLATRDPLTALANRSTFNDRLEQNVRIAFRRNSHLGVLFIDLDRFKPINDTLGHDVGDEALLAVAERLNRCIRKSDTVARLGGDEFAVILPDVMDEQEAMKVADKIAVALREPVIGKLHQLHCSASIGVAVFPEHGRLSDQLLRHADLAMYQAKKAGGDQVRLFNSKLSEQANATQILERELREALDRKEFVLYFQPQAPLLHGRLCGLEALVRWQHPSLGMILPAQFIPLAEQRGMIFGLGFQVMDMALEQLRAWDEQGLSVPRIAVNVSPRELREDFVARVDNLLTKHGIAPHRLELEITETLLIMDGVEVMSMLSRLQEQGVSIAVDDFGVGYSSLAQLHCLPVDCLKIDRGFIQDITRSAIDVAIVRAVVTLADAMELRTIAEGVETEEQLAVVEALGCHCIQGYLLARPMPANEATQWLIDRGVTSSVKAEMV